MSDIHPAAGVHPAAPHHLPPYIPGSDGSDPLFTAVVVIMIVIFMTMGVVYFKLHSLPEHLGVKQNSNQLLLISVLAILALFTHNNIFWVLALLVAVIRLPDFLTPLNSIADSLKELSAVVDDRDVTAHMDSLEPVSESGADVSVSAASEEPFAPPQAEKEKKEG